MISLLEHKLLQADDRRNTGSLRPLVGHTRQSWSFLGTCLGQKIIEIQRDSGTGAEPRVLPISRDLRPLCQRGLVKCAVCCLFWMLSFCTEILCLKVPGLLEPYCFIVHPESTLSVHPFGFLCFNYISLGGKGPIPHSAAPVHTLHVDRSCRCCVAFCGVQGIPIQALSIR